MLIHRYVRAHARSLILLAALSGAAAGVSMLLLAYFNERAAQGMNGASPAVVLQGFALLAAMLAARALNARIASAFGSQLVAELREDLCGRFLQLDIEHLQHRKHAIFGAMIGDIGRLVQIVQMAPVLLTNLLLAVLGIGYLIYLSGALFGVVVPFIALSGAIFVVAQRVNAGSFDEMRKADESLIELMRTLVEGKKELTLIQQRAWQFVNGELLPAIGRARSAQFRATVRWGFVEAFAEAITHGWVLAAILAGSLWLGESPTLILQFVIAGLFLGGPIHSLFDLGDQLSSGRASLRHLEGIGFDLEQEPGTAVKEPVPALQGWRKIELNGVTYSYSDAATTGYRLGPIDLDISRGQTLFISGGNGSGKSTLLLLLCGLLAPGSGKICIDGQLLGPGRIAGYRGLFSAVFFDFMVFAHVIDGKGRPAAPALVSHWLKAVQLESKVELLDDGKLSSVDLSQGQRKRLAFVQSCLDDREILIFDELTADQDREFRDRFYNELLPALKRAGKTLIVVTHDDRYWHCADRVVKLDCGMLREANLVEDLQSVHGT